jgi:nucleoside-diphosphate-sugar epimerase
VKRVLITGADGFIGSHCLLALKDSYEQVHAVAYDGINGEHLPKVQWHKLDLLDRDQLAAVMKALRPTHLLHLAWHMQNGKQFNAAENFRWLKAGIDLFELFYQNGGQRIVVAGSCAEYDWRHPYLSEASTPLTPLNLYGRCKHALQTVLDAYHTMTSLDYAWARIFFTYGPRENPNRLVASVIRSLLKDEEAFCSHGDQIRDYLYVKDIADALTRILDSSLKGPINIGSGEPVKLKRIIGKIAELMGGKQDLIRLGALTAPAEEPSVLVADVQRIKKELGWQPKFDLETGLAQTIAWWRHRRDEEVS